MNSAVVKKIFLFNVLLAFAINCMAQEDTNKYFLVKDVVYAAGDTLKADLYMPVNYQRQKNAVLIFIDGFGTDFRKWDHYTGWAKFAASKGYVGVVYTSRKDYTNNSFKNILHFLSVNKDKYFIDDEKIAAYAGSGNVLLGLPYINNDTRIKAALIFYGTANLEGFRLNLPVLLVRAGFDNVQLNRGLDTLAFRALAANAPYTITNFNTAVHGFEDFSNNSIEQKFLDQSLDFLTMNMQEAVQQKLTENENEVIAVRELYKSHWNAAFEGYTKVLQSNPGNNEAERQLGNICIEMKEYGKALEYYDAALLHGNWRKGEIAVKKIIACSKLGRIEAAVSEMRLLKKIGWFKESDYEGKEAFSQILQSTSYKNFVKEK